MILHACVLLSRSCFRIELLTLTRFFCAAQGFALIRLPTYLPFRPKDHSSSTLCLELSGDPQKPTGRKIRTFWFNWWFQPLLFLSPRKIPRLSVNLIVSKLGIMGEGWKDSKALQVVTDHPTSMGCGGPGVETRAETCWAPTCAILRSILRFRRWIPELDVQCEKMCAREQSVVFGLSHEVKEM